jgi:hypothetical protein
MTIAKHFIPDAPKFSDEEMQRCRDTAITSLSYSSGINSSVPYVVSLPISNLIHRLIGASLLNTITSSPDC